MMNEFAGIGMTEDQKLIMKYAYEADIFSLQYDVMGKLLDEESVCDALRLRNVSDLFIYGGGYLGLQLLRTIKNKYKVIGIIDKKGKTKYKQNYVPIYNLQTLKEIYKGECIIITPLAYSAEVYIELKEVIGDSANLILLTELV